MTKPQTIPRSADRSEHQDRAAIASPPIGILAGGGVLPIEVARAIIKGGGHVHIVGIHGEADRQIEDFSHSWCHWGGLGALIGGLHQAGCKELVIVGSVRRPDLRSLRPDFGLLAALPTVVKLFHGGDDQVLTKVVRFFEGNGFTVRGCHEFAKHLLAEAGILGLIAPNAEQQRAMQKAAVMLKDLGSFDIGQAAIATPKRIIAIEGAGGTDAMIRNYCRARDQDAGLSADERDNAVLVKLPKPGQELRIDMPAIGPNTIAMAKMAGLAGVAVASGKTLMLDRPELLAAANDAQIFVAGIDEVASADNGATETGATDKGTSKTDCAGAEFAKSDYELVAIGRVIPNASDWRDIEIGCRLMAMLSKHDAGHGVVVVRRYVLGVRMSDTLGEFLQMVIRARPFNGFFLRRHGILVLPAQSGDEVGETGQPNDPVLGEDEIQLMRDGRLKGIVFTKAPTDCSGKDGPIAGTCVSPEIMALAAKAGLFIMIPKGCV